MQSLDIESFAIHVGVPRAEVRRSIARAEARRFHVFRLEVEDMQSNDELDVYLSQTFHYPWRTRGLNAAVDMLSDLDWLGPANGYLFVSAGFGSDEIATSLGWVVPSVVDRWRSGEAPCVFIFESRSDAFEKEAAQTNAHLEEASHLPWVAPGTGPVPICRY